MFNWLSLPPVPDVLQVRGRDILWQKERLINLGVNRLPPQATKVAWVDGDILFTNPDWAEQFFLTRREDG